MRMAINSQVVTHLECPTVQAFQRISLQPERRQASDTLEHLPQPERIESIEQVSQSASTRDGAASKPETTQHARMFEGKTADPAQRILTAEQCKQHQTEQCRKWVTLTAPSTWVRQMLEGLPERWGFNSSRRNHARSLGQRHGFLERLHTEFLTKHPAAAFQVIAGHLGLTVLLAQAHGGTVGALVQRIFAQQGLDGQQRLAHRPGAFKFKCTPFQGFEVHHGDAGAFKLEPITESRGAIKPETPQQHARTGG